MKMVNFDTLVDDFEFTFKGKEYVIHPLSNTKVVELMKLSKELSVKDSEDSELDIEKVMDSQYQFICAAVVTKGTNVPVTEEEIKEWPSLMTRKVIDLINEQISGQVEEGSEEEKKS